MAKKNEPTFEQSVQLARLQAWVMSFVCGLLCLFALAAATRIPHYLAAPDYVRLIGVILFSLLALVGLVDNIHTHIRLWQMRNEITQGASMSPVHQPQNR